MLIYARTSCGLRTVVSILKIFEEVMEGACGDVPCYNTVRDWVLKLGLSVYDDDIPKGMKYITVQDESIMINREKILVTLALPSEHPGRSVQHSDAVVVGMAVGSQFKKEDVQKELERVSDEMGAKPEYALSDGGHNLVGGAKLAGIPHHLDISHTLGNCMKRVYGQDPEFAEFTTKLGKVRLQYHLTDKALLLPPNMRAIARFMNLSEWVRWGMNMLAAYDSLDQKYKDAYAFVPENRSLIEELNICTQAIRHVEKICKNDGLNLRTVGRCRSYVIRNVIGNANNRRASLGLKMLDYFDREAKLLKSNEDSHHISSDILESKFGIFKGKQSPNKLNGITPLVLMIPLYPKIIDYSVALKQDFKVRLANVKLKDIDLWAKENLSPNMVSERARILKKAS